MPGAAATTLTRDLIYIAPEIALTVWGLVVLCVDFGALRRWAAPRRRFVLGAVTLAGVVGALVYGFLVVKSNGSVYECTGLGYDRPDPTIFFGTIAGDALTAWMNVTVLALLALVVGMSMTWDFTRHWGEYYALLLWAAVGMMLLCAADELLTLFLTLETMTLCLYLITAFEKDRRRSAEGGLKYFVYGSVSSALFLFGLSLIYGLTGTTRLEAIRFVLSGPNEVAGLSGNIAGAMAVLLVMVGFGFKVAAVPFHQWAPDAYEGAPAPVTAWIASGSKIASFIAMMKVFIFALGPWKDTADSVTTPGWVGIVALVAAASMTFGNLAALAQRNLKRMLAYSSIAHAGYLLVGVLAAAVSIRREQAAGAVLFYLVTYGFTTVGAFAVAAWLAWNRANDDIDDLNGLGFQAPALALCIVILMLSLIGMPPLAGFFGKLYMFMEALDARDRGWSTLVLLVALALVNSVISAFYYVRVLKAMFLRDPARAAVAEPPRGIRWPIVLATAVVVIFGVYPAPLLEAMRGAAVPMLTTQRSLAGESTNSRFVTGRDPNFDFAAEARRQAAEIEKNRALLSPSMGDTPPPPPAARPKGSRPAPKR
jgi:NADH-quinone oxidoreductase subunit N